MLDSGVALFTAGLHQGQMDYGIPSVVPREARGGANDGAQDHGAEAQAVGEAAQSMNTRVRGDLVAAQLHHDPGRCYYPSSAKRPPGWGRWRLDNTGLPVLWAVLQLHTPAIISLRE